MQEIQVTYLNHSGFRVVMDDLCMVFDYWPGESGQSGRLTRADLACYSQVIVFVSHSHPDHFTPEIYDWLEPGRVHYVLGDDVPEPYIGQRLRPGGELRLGGAFVSAYESTDLGVSFLVRYHGATLFHAGDLNLWHWRDVSSTKEIEDAERAFHRAVKPLEGLDVDVAFFPVDPRQGSLYDAGAGYFAMAVKPRLMIPMHWQGRVDVAQEFVRLNRSRRTEMVALTRPFDRTVYVRQENDTPAANESMQTSGAPESPSDAPEKGEGPAPTQAPAGEGEQDEPTSV